MVQRLLLWTVTFLTVTLWTAGLWTTQPVSAEVTPNLSQPSMVIEWLKFRVDPVNLDHYLEIDDEIWTAALKTYPGFLDKATWLDPNHDDEVIFVITWATREQWKSIPEAELDQINQRFDTTLGFDYDFLESKEFYVPSGPR